ncbi:MAG: M14 family metallopeptidase, partial [Alphaproteobacteria bacterium]|nr:M14 family metallopeptidase [Alphaproteobacteria bacterium]
MSKGAKIITPREHLGFEVGEDRKLASWDEIVGYFKALDKASDRMQLSELGKSTEGAPLIMAIMSSPENLASLDRYREIQAKLADPRKIADDKEAESLIAEGKTVMLLTCSVHGTEVGASQMSMLVAHRMATGDDETVRSILDNVIFLFVPCLNPDGLTIVKDWYDSTLGTYYEGVNPPVLYNTYTGHDNNRDWFMFTQVETRLAIEHCHNVWRPHIVFDMHQTRQDGMRLILPPFIDPIDPNVDPVLQGNIAMMGSAMAAELTGQGKAGVGINVTYDIFSPSRAYQHYHGGVRILSEAASVKIATPIELDAGELTIARGADPFRRAWNHPQPWQGGAWRLRDIVDYDYAAVMACLGNAARYREIWLRGFLRIGRNAVADQRAPYAYLIPEAQWDPVTAAELLEILDFADVELHEATADFVADGISYPKGTRIVLAAQPYGAFAKTMLGTAQYPKLHHYEGGPPVQPYDNTAHSLPLQMGVEAIEVT